MDAYYGLFYTLLTIVATLKYVFASAGEDNTKEGKKDVSGGMLGQFRTVILCSSKDAQEAEFLRLQRSYLIVFLLYKLSDWLMGPYFYDVYASKGLDNADISRLFLMGFGSSMLFGSIMGSLADKMGRKNGCIMFCIFYGLSAFSVHADSYTLLALGRISGGIATDLLMTLPEGYISSTAAKYPSNWLGNLFGWAYALDSIVAIIAGFVSSELDQIYGANAPFTLALGILIFAAILTQFLWTQGPESASNSSFNTSGEEEDSGESSNSKSAPKNSKKKKKNKSKQSEKSSKSSKGAVEVEQETDKEEEQSEKTKKGFLSAVSLVISTPKLLKVGLTQALFEASMYVVCVYVCRIIFLALSLSQHITHTHVKCKI